MPTINDTPRKVKYITRSIVPSSAAKVPAFYNDLCYIWVTSEQLARFDHQRGNLSRAEYLDELLDIADGKPESWRRNDALFEGFGDDVDCAELEY